MHWTPEHAQPLNQWPEQHLDVSSTTSSPAHKSDLYHNSRQRFNYTWANDDISALTASNLLKRYAEKYSGVLDSPYDRPSALNTYGDGVFGPLNGQKGEMEPWPMAHGSEGAYPLTPIHDGLSGSKGIVAPAVTPGNSLGTSPVVSSNLSDSIYPSNACGGPATSGGLGTPQEYPSGYSGAYLPSGYCSQPASALPPPHSSTLHGSGLLQPSHPPATLVPGYGSPGPMYNYASGSYPPQPGYAAIHPPHPPASYLPSGIAAPTPIPPSSRPPVVPGYTYQSPLAVPSLSNEAGNPLKRKAFDVAGGEDESEGRYRKYSYEQPKSPYQMSDSGECRGNGFNRSSEVPFKGGKRPAGAGVVAPAAVPAAAPEEPLGKYAGQPLKELVSPAYGVGEAPLRPGENFEKFTPPAANGEHEGESFALRMPPKAPAFSGDSGSSQGVEEQLKTMDPFVLELVNSKIVDGGPPVQWTDIAGHVSVKAAIEEELVWPILRPGAYTGAGRPPKTILLFGPRGVGKTLLSRCISTQLGSTLLKLSGTALASKGKAEAEKILQTTFFVSNCRQPAVLLLADVESFLDDAAALKPQLLSYLDNLATSGEQNVVVVATTTRPGNLDEATQRRFARRFYISPPDSMARRQILHHALAQQNYCLSEREMASLVQLTKSYSGGELLQLCQQAGANKLHGLPGQLQPTSYKDFESIFRKIHPSVSQKELDLYVEWDKMYGSRH